MKDYKIIYYDEKKEDTFSHFMETEAELYAEIEKAMYDERIKSILHYETSLDRVRKGEIVWKEENRFEVEWKTVWELEEE